MGSFGPLLSSGRCLESLSRKFGLQEEALYADMRLWAPRVGGLSPQNKGALPQHRGTDLPSSPQDVKFLCTPFLFFLSGHRAAFEAGSVLFSPKPEFQGSKPLSRVQSLVREPSPIWEAQSWICRARRLQSTTSLLLAGSLGNRRHRVPGLSLAVCHRQL